MCVGAYGVYIHNRMCLYGTVQAPLAVGPSGMYLCSGCMRTYMGLSPRVQGCECGHAVTAGPQWECLRAPHNSLATLGRRCLPALP